MQLTLEQLQSITNGAVSVTCEEDGFHFYRFTQEQQALYQSVSADFYKKTQSTAGIVLAFSTDSEMLSMDGIAINGSGRTFYMFDIFVNGRRIDSFGSFGHGDPVTEYTTLTYPLGPFSHQISLGEGTKEVEVYFPWSVKAVIRDISLDDGASLTPIRKMRTLVCYGDSITHGYDSIHPSNALAPRMAKLLDAEAYVKAIGGDFFFPQLAAIREDFDPDYIFVAYGTNDWFGKTREDFIHRCRAFYQTLSANYPGAKIFAVTPIWRKDLETQRPFGAFADVDTLIHELTADLSNVTVIPGFHLVPHDENLYGDFLVHPNDRGFDHYFAGLKEHLLAGK